MQSQPRRAFIASCSKTKWYACSIPSCVPARLFRCIRIAVYIVSCSDCLRRDADGRVTMDSRNTAALTLGAALWSGPLPPHTLENIGDGDLRVIAIEQKQVTENP